MAAATLDSTRKTTPKGETRPKARTPPGRMSRGLLAAGMISERVTRPILGRRGLAESNLIAHWPAIVGPLVSSFAAPERIRFLKGGRENGELLIRVASGSFALHLQHDAPRVIERVNGYFGYPAVTKLRIKQGAISIREAREPPRRRPLTKREKRDVHAVVAGVENPDLRAALEALGRRLKEKARHRMIAPAP